MFEVYDDKSKAVIKNAQQEARTLGHKLVGTEHLLYAMLCDESHTSKTLERCGLSREMLRSEIVKLTGWGEKLDFGGNLFFDPSTTRSFERAVEEMASQGDEVIEVEHLFLAITYKNETIASLLLEQCGKIRQRARDEVRKYLKERVRNRNGSHVISKGSSHDRSLSRQNPDDGMMAVLQSRIDELERKVDTLTHALQERVSDIATVRTGFGFDSHRLEPGIPLMLGGAPVPFEKGLRGHSDGDVLLHAIIDAIFGAMASGDIGRHFPDTDERYRGISSMLLLSMCHDMMGGGGYGVTGLDAVILAEKPRLAPFVDIMRKNISDVLSVSQHRVSIKCKTAEGMGFIGEGRGMASYALVTLSQSQV